MMLMVVCTTSTRYTKGNEKSNKNKETQEQITAKTDNSQPDHIVKFPLYGVLSVHSE